MNLYPCELFGLWSSMNNRGSKVLLFVTCLVPFVLCGWDYLTNQLGSKPIEVLSQRTGDWALRFLLITLAITPFRHLFGWSGLVRYRRMLGLYVFFYAVLHLLIYLIVDKSLSVSDIASDIVKRPYLAVGLFAFLLTIPLAFTSTDAMKRRLGKRWKALHQLVYVIAALGILHYLWMAKGEILQPVVYVSLFLVMISYRSWNRSMAMPVAAKVVRSLRRS